jgi:esterase/lipase superfamily enzyme
MGAVFFMRRHDPARTIALALNRCSMPDTESVRRVSMKYPRHSETVFALSDRCLAMKTIRRLGVFGLLLGLPACGEAVYDSIELMPPPAVYIAGEVDPFPRVSEANYQEQAKLFYVTDRKPASAEDAAAFYANERGFGLRAGVVDVRADPPFSGWEEVRAASIVHAEASPRRELRISSVEEFGFLPVEQISLLPETTTSEERAAVGRRFAAEVNGKLGASVQKDIFIFVHGYNVDFDYPILSSKELQHYLGYRGAFITYAWPATPNRLAYFKDLETADSTRKNLRELIKFLSQSTKAENIHIIGYSAGSRLAFEAVYDLVLQYSDGRANAPRMGQLMLIGSDLDRSYFVQALDDGLLDLMDSITIYMSSTDAALKMSSFVLGQDRVGQVSLENDDPQAREAMLKIRKISDLRLIDVSDAEGSSFGNGHSYFRSSPWASSDMFVSLIYNMGPGERGLQRARDEAVWTFPQDFPVRIIKAVKNRPR